MKKGLFLCLLLSIVSIMHAEELKFVTVLSSPVGTFNKLEEVDPSKPVQSPVINFCTSIGNEGTVTLKGNKQPDIETLNLLQNTTLGGDGQNYILNSLTMKDGGTLKGSRLLANTVKISQPTVGKSADLYTNELTVSGAKTKTLDINNGESKIEEQHDAADMVWSNEYQTDKACGADCKKQYLLKQKGTISIDKCRLQTPRTWWDESAQKCGCPNADEYYHNGACCSYSNKEDPKCWKKTGGALEWLSGSSSELRPGKGGLTCSDGNLIGGFTEWAGPLKTKTTCSDYSCSGSCSASSSPATVRPGEEVRADVPVFSGLACFEEGATCISNVRIWSEMGACYITYSYNACMMATPSYQKLWDESVDTRYDCGH